MRSEGVPTPKQAAHLRVPVPRREGFARKLHPAKLSFRMEGQIKYFPDKVKLKEFIITKPLLYEMLKGLT